MEKQPRPLAAMTLFLTVQISALCQTPVYSVYLSAGEDAPSIASSVFIPAAEPLEFTVRSSDSWLAVGFNKTVLPANLQIISRIAGLQPGAHIGTVTVGDVFGSRILAYVKVYLDIVPNQYLTLLRASPDGATTVRLTNTSPRSARVDVRFWRSHVSDDGSSHSPAWHFPFSDRAAADSVYETLAPHGTLQLISRRSKEPTVGWAEIRADRYLLVSSVFTEAKRSDSRVNKAIYGDLVSRATPLYTLVENTNAATTGLRIVNPNTTAVEVTVDVLNSLGGRPLTRHSLNMEPKASRTLGPQDYMGMTSHPPFTGLAIIEAAGGLPIMAAAERHSKDSTAIIPATGQATPNWLARSLPLFDGGIGPSEIVVVNTLSRPESGLISLHPSRMASPQLNQQFNPREVSMARTFPSFSIGLVNPAESGSFDWADLLLLQSVRTFSSVASPVRASIELVELASIPHRGNLIWSAKPGEYELSMSNVGHDPGIVMLLVKDEVNSFNRITIPAKGNIRLKWRVQDSSVGRMRVQMLEAVNVTGVPLVATLSVLAEENIIIPSIPR